MPVKKRTKNVKDVLKDATVPAVEMLAATMNDPDVKPELRMKCAEAILDRVFGKSAQPMDNSASEAAVLRVEMCSDSESAGC
jgi:hypothetical protein